MKKMIYLEHPTEDAGTAVFPDGRKIHWKTGEYQAVLTSPWLGTREIVTYRADREGELDNEEQAIANIHGHINKPMTTQDVVEWEQAMIDLTITGKKLMEEDINKIADHLREIFLLTDTKSGISKKAHDESVEAFNRLERIADRCGITIKPKT